MYVPPDRMLSSRSYSFFAAACFSAAVSGFDSSASFVFSLSSICLCRSSALERSTSLGSGPFLAGGGDLETDLRRSGGARRSGEGEREVGDLFLPEAEPFCSGSAGSADGSRALLSTAAAMLVGRLVR